MPLSDPVILENPYEVLIYFVKREGNLLELSITMNA